jgi:hypothetical protein
MVRCNVLPRFARELKNTLLADIRLLAVLPGVVNYYKF